MSTAGLYHLYTVMSFHNFTSISLLSVSIYLYSYFPTLSQGFQFNLNSKNISLHSPRVDKKSIFVILTWTRAFNIFSQTTLKLKIFSTYLSFWQSGKLPSCKVRRAQRTMVKDAMDCPKSGARVCDETVV